MRNTGVNCNRSGEWREWGPMAKRLGGAAQGAELNAASP
jgi:hypothetical protein